MKRDAGKLYRLIGVCRLRSLRSLRSTPPKVLALLEVVGSSKEAAPGRSLSGVVSLLPPRVVAELTWTIFDQFPDIDAVRLSFYGYEAACCGWLTSDGSDAEPFSQKMGERI